MFVLSIRKAQSLVSKSCALNIQIHEPILKRNYCKTPKVFSTEETVLAYLECYTPRLNMDAIFKKEQRVDLLFY